MWANLSAFGCSVLVSSFWISIIYVFGFVVVKPAVVLVSDLFYIIQVLGLRTAVLRVEQW